jgi:pyruvate dehydrogenase E2 component (dihydrolipoamide acetyltransferase)
MAELHTVVPLSPLRKVIAARMTEAKLTIPHFRLAIDLEMDALLSWRERHNVETPDARVSLNDCLIKACASALVEHPAVNAQLVENEIHAYRDADISIVIAVEGGLSTPVVRAANCKSVREIAAEVKSFAARAQRGQLKMHEIMGGSFSISNLGMYGIDQFDAIINPPQCAILAVARAKPSVVVSENGVTRLAKVLRATLAVDHRAIDGATGAAFLQRLRQVVEHPQDALGS